MGIGAWVGERLERGDAGGPLALLASRAWAASARVERPLRWRDGAIVIVVGGATLGGSGKTPLAMASVETLRRRGVAVALVGHAHGARPGRARQVRPGDDVREVGDEALECARRLSSRGAPVVVGRTRQEALDYALDLADVVVVDGPLQTRPRRASLSLLALDARAPWGSSLCPPRGDLRAPTGSLLRATDRVVLLGDASSGVPRLAVAGVPTPPVDRASTTSVGAWIEGRLAPWGELRGLRVGLWTAIARPDRVTGALLREGIAPVVAVRELDHRPDRRPLPTRGVDLWLCTPKCRAHLEGDGPARAAPLGVIDFEVTLASRLEEVLAEGRPLYEADRASRVGRGRAA